MNFLNSLTLVAVLVGTSALADSGALLRPDQLPPTTAEKLQLEIAAAKKQNPRAFAALDEVRNRLPELNAKKRGRLVPLSLMLKPMREEALFPLIEHIAFNSPRTGLNEAEWLSWRIGLLETLGVLRDPRARPLFEAVLDGSMQDLLVMRAAAEGLARLGDDAAAAKLVQLARPGPKQAAVLAGMGACRRLVVAQLLAETLPSLEGSEAKSAIKSLGEVGNSWAWKTPAVTATKEETEVRATAARALVSAFVRWNGELRDAASNALMVVDADVTHALIDAELSRAPTSETRAALDALKERFANNPVR